MAWRTSPLLLPVARESTRVQPAGAVMAAPSLETTWAIMTSYCWVEVGGVSDRLVDGADVAGSVTSRSLMPVVEVRRATLTPATLASGRRAPPEAVGVVAAVVPAVACDS